MAFHVVVVGLGHYRVHTKGLPHQGMNLLFMPRWGLIVKFQSDVCILVDVD